MVCHSHGVVKYAPLYRHSFKFLQSRFLADAEKLNIPCDEPVQLVSTADKFRYYRYKKGLLQREVADYLGIERTTYNAYEVGLRDYYPIDILKPIAELFEVDMADLLDEYNAFLWAGQASQVKALRKEMGLTQSDFAAKFDVYIYMVKRWEQGKVRMTKKMWERIFWK